MPTIVNVLRGEAGSTRVTPYGVVGTVYSGHGIEAVWVSKRGEQVDPGWFVPDTVDLILLREGHLRVEFEAAELDDRVLEPGDLLVLPPGQRCRAYCWPRDVDQAARFLAVYPTEGASPGHTASP